MSFNGEITDKIYCLNKDELGLLLGAIKITHFYCFENEENEGEFRHLSQEESNDTILRLIKAGIMNVKDDSYSVCDDMKKILGVFKQATHILFVYPGNTKRDVMCIYISNDSFVIARPGKREEEYIRLSVRNMENLRLFLTEIPLSEEGSLSNYSDKIELYDINKGFSKQIINVNYRFGIPHDIAAKDDVCVFSDDIFVEKIINQLGV